MQYLTPHKTTLMGILNITPDSFSDGGEWFGNPQKAVDHAREMLSQGATIIDIGGESTRPGAEKVSVEEECRRVIPIITKLRKKAGDEFFISIDTYKAEVAEKAIDAGANIINDVSGLQLDENMSTVAAKTGVPIIINHMRGNPQTMQQGNIAYDDVVQDIFKFFEKQIALLENNGVLKENIILDPGFGFGKTVEQNLEILKRLHEFKKLNAPILIGVSRKSTFGKILQDEFGLSEPVLTGERVEASLAATAVAVLHGASIVRTHDVLETRRFLAVIDRIKQ